MRFARIWNSDHFAVLPTTPAKSPFEPTPPQTTTRGVTQKTSSLLATATLTMRKTKGAQIPVAPTNTSAPDAKLGTHNSPAAAPPDPTGSVLQPIPTVQTSIAPTVKTPVNPAKLNKLLQGYPHRQQIIEGIAHGFTLHFDGPQSSLTSKNSPSLYANINIAREKK